AMEGLDGPQKEEWEKWVKVASRSLGVESAEPKSDTQAKPEPKEDLKLLQGQLDNLQAELLKSRLEMAERDRKLAESIAPAIPPNAGKEPVRIIEIQERIRPDRQKPSEITLRQVNGRWTVVNEPEQHAERIIIRVLPTQPLTPPLQRTPPGTNSEG